jgi:hypothetical protein
MSQFKYKIDSVSKVLDQINKLDKKEERIEALRVNGVPVLKNILKNMFDPNVKFLLPEGRPPFRPNRFDEPKALLQEAHKFYLFVEGGNPNLKSVRREQLFIQILEVVNADDAELLLAMKDKKCPYKGITRAIVNEAFPGLLSA